MRDLQCPAVCDWLEAQGFYFTGIHPLHDGQEFLLYHRECEGGYDWSELVLTKGNRALTDYVANHR